MERDWYRRVMLKLVDVREYRGEDYLRAVDSELDELVLRLDELRRAGGMTGLSVRRGLNMLSELRSRLEVAVNSQEVRQAFTEFDAVKGLIEEAEQVLEGDKA